jgi:hypothetical protein
VTGSPLFARLWNRQASTVDGTTAGRGARGKTKWVYLGQGNSCIRYRRTLDTTLTGPFLASNDLSLPTIHAISLICDIQQYMFGRRSQRPSSHTIGVQNQECGTLGGFRIGSLRHEHVVPYAHDCGFLECVSCTLSPSNHVHFILHYCSATGISSQRPSCAYTDALVNGNTITSLFNPHLRKRIPYPAVVQ